MTRDELARRSGISPGYLVYLEEHPAEVTTGTVVRLAAALESTVPYLLGEGTSIAPGRGGPAAHPVLEVIPRQECDQLLASGGVGRVLLVEERGPVAMPVNFGVLDGDIVFRTAAATTAAGAAEHRVGFEVDRIDDAMSEGWSVLITGRARRVVDPDELARARGLDIRPWAGGERDVYLRLAPTEVSGRRIRAANSGHERG